MLFRPEGTGGQNQKAAVALVAGEALPVAGHALVLVPGIIDGADLKAGGDHGHVLPHTQGWPYNWMLTRSS